MSAPENSSMVVKDQQSTAIAEAGVWNDSLVKLIKKQICPAGIPDGEFELFIAKCKQSGMNPLLGEAYCVPRGSMVKTGRKDAKGWDIKEWVEQFVFQPSEQGMEARADRFDDYQGIRAAAVYANDIIEIQPSEGIVRHSFNPVGTRGDLIGAWACADRKGRKTPVEYIKFSEYCQYLKDSTKPAGQWAIRPETMIVKCARAAALRRAYPQAFSGVYAPAESLEREVDVTPDDTEAPTETPVSTTRTDALKEKLKKTAAKASPPAAERTVDAATEPVPPTDFNQDAPPPDMDVEEPLLKFNPDMEPSIKNRPIRGLDDMELGVAIDFAKAKLVKEPEAKWARPMALNLEELLAERKFRTDVKVAT